MRLFALTARMRPWEEVTRVMRDFSESRGIGRVLAFPGALSSVVSAVADPDDTGVWRALTYDGWVRQGWTTLFGDWISEELTADAANTSPTPIFRNRNVEVTMYRKAGVAVHRLNRTQVDILRSPDRAAFDSWIDRRVMSNVGSGGHLVRFVAPNRGDADEDGAEDIPPFDPSAPPGSKAWRIEVTPTSGRGRIVEGSWAPSLDVVSDALVGGRTILMFGPPGAGKTELAIRAARDGRVVLIPGTAFGRGMGGRDAAEVTDLFRAKVLIVDDMPPSATVRMLEEFEVLSRRGVSVVVTVMTDGSRPHLRGLRPGRVDEMFEFGLPDAEGREALLRHFAPGIDWSGAANHELCEGMTPAYLKELARRVTGPSGRTGWMGALQSLAVQRDVAT
ncbi:MAG: hypothetical protein EBT79_06495 [Actinobacteria bacterium]|nr:hypothetical protein [Actinomycetota bacterium]